MIRGLAWWLLCWLVGALTVDEAMADAIVADAVREARARGLE